MALKALPSIEVLRQLLDYDPDTGALTWRERGPEMFVCGRNSPEGSARSFNTHYAGKPALSAKDNNGYGHGHILREKYQAHRIAWKMGTGQDPTYQIDHINGDKSDNRIVNLRDVPQSENCKNAASPSHNTSGAMGVSWCRQTGRWRARAQHKGQNICFGRYTNFDDAVNARQRGIAALDFHPNHGRLRAGPGHG